MWRCCKPSATLSSWLPHQMRCARSITAKTNGATESHRGCLKKRSRRKGAAEVCRGKHAEAEGRLSAFPHLTSGLAASQLDSQNNSVARRHVLQNAHMPCSQFQPSPLPVLSYPPCQRQTQYCPLAPSIGEPDTRATPATVLRWTTLRCIMFDC
jgi:hypothetical protein